MQGFEALKTPSPTHRFIAAQPSKNRYIISPSHLIIPNKTPSTEDPLWELVCTDVIHLMGPVAQHIRHCKPKTLSHKDKVIDLDCETQEAALFVQQFAFIILGSLKPYFPNLTEIRVKNYKETEAF